MSPKRAGQYVRQPSGFRAFIPANLPPDPPIVLDRETLAILSQADQAIGRLDGATQMLPNPDLFVAMYVRREAVDSSAIEGTQSTLQDVLAFELDPRIRDLPRDVEEVVNYVRAMNFGLNRASSLPLSLRLIREIHGVLMEGVRGENRSPGEFRRTQNWIGPPNATLQTATFVPPPVPDMQFALDNLERFLHNPDHMQALVHCAVCHAQFETIHPFLDGNGRVGRLLISFLLVHERVLHRPLLYLSHYLKRHRRAYYDALMSVRRDGDWEQWIRFFLEGVVRTSTEATATAQEIIRLQDTHRRELVERGAGSNDQKLLDLLYDRPLINIQLVAQKLVISDRTAGKLISRFEELGWLTEVTGRQRDRMYRYEAYWDIFVRSTTDRPGNPEDDETQFDETPFVEIPDAVHSPPRDNR